ncbi:MAG: metallophosphoesterase [Candidatus Taylorbacteria bacterium]|nr:metallophosphoesterase [Candidatus Taylorbacteria bacterium]
MKLKKNIIVVLLLIVIIASIYFVFYFIRSGRNNYSLPKVDPATSFTVIVLPDTQFYSADHPDIFCKQTQWIVDHKKDLNIVFVSQLGDIVNDGAKRMDEWANASKCMGKLDGVVPYSVIPGNHDADISSNKSSGFTAFDSTFPVSRFNANSWYGGNYGDNRNNYEIISVDVEHPQKLLFLNLEIEPTDKVLEWADGIVKAHPDFYTILTTHKYLLAAPGSGREGTVDFSSDGNSGEGIWNKLVKDDCSISMVWSGHNHGENRISSLNSCGKNVNQIVQDYQTLENGGDGWLRIYIFTPTKHAIEVYTYSPYLDKSNMDLSSRFDLSM